MECMPSVGWCVLATRIDGLICLGFIAKGVNRLFFAGGVPRLVYTKSEISIKASETTQGISLNLNLSKI